MNRKPYHRMLLSNVFKYILLRWSMIEQFHFWCDAPVRFYKHLLYVYCVHVREIAVDLHDIRQCPEMNITFDSIKSDKIWIFLFRRTEKGQSLNLIDLFGTNQMHRCKMVSFGLSLNCHHIFGRFPFKLNMNVWLFYGFCSTWVGHDHFVTFNYGRILSLPLNCDHFFCRYKNHWMTFLYYFNELQFSGNEMILGMKVSFFGSNGAFDDS